MAFQDLLTWIAVRLTADGSGPAKGDFSPILKPLYKCMSDRSADVRHAAQKAFPPLYDNCGYDVAKKKLEGEDKATLALALPLLEKAREVSTRRGWERGGGYWMCAEGGGVTWRCERVWGVGWMDD